MTKWGDFGSEPGLAGDTEAVLAYLTYIMLQRYIHLQVFRGVLLGAGESQNASHLQPQEGPACVMCLLFCIYIDVAVFACEGYGAEDQESHVPEGQPEPSPP